MPSQPSNVRRPYRLTAFILRFDSEKTWTEEVEKMKFMLTDEEFTTLKSVIAPTYFLEPIPEMG